MMAAMLGRPRRRKGSLIPHIPLNACVQEDEAYNIHLNCYHTTRFFRGKPTVRCYPPVSVPRVAVWQRHPESR